MSYELFFSYNIVGEDIFGFVNSNDNILSKHKSLGLRFLIISFPYFWLKLLSFTISTLFLL